MLWVKLLYWKQVVVCRCLLKIIIWESRQVYYHNWDAISLFFKKLIVGLIVLVSTISSATKAADVIVTDVRVGTDQGTTRVVFDVNRLVRFSIFTLGNPNRVVIDLPEVGWRLPARPLPRSNGVFKQLRYGLFRPGNSRVVLDIQMPAEVTNAFILGPNDNSGHRLVIDLVPSTLKTFNRKLGLPPIKVETVQGSFKLKSRKFSGKNPLRTKTKPDVNKFNPLSKRQEIVKFIAPPPKTRINRRSQKKIIFIDPGHGGIDPGTIGISGVYEKHITLAMARELKLQLEKTGRFKVLMSRKRDVFVRLRERVRMARDKKSDLFISIHADSVRNKKIKGPAVYTLSEKSSDKEAQRIAERENKADLIAGVDLTYEMPEVTNILIDLAQRESMNQSARFATSLIRELKRKTRVLRNTHRFAGFAVLKAPDIPSILLELGFLSNPKDERRLRSKAYRSQLASAVTKAVTGHFLRIEEATLK